MWLCRDGRAKPPRDRSISPAPFVYQNTSKMTQSAKSSTTQNRSKSHSKALVNSRTKKAAETGGSGNTAASGSTTTATASKPSQGGNNVPKMKKSQKQQPKVPNPGPSLHSDAQLSSYPTAHGVQSKTSNGNFMQGQPVKELNPFNQTSNQPSDPTQQKSTLEDSSGSSSGSSSSSSSGSSDSESEPESPSRHVLPPSLPSSGGGVNVTSSMNMPSFQPSQPPAAARGTVTTLFQGLYVVAQQPFHQSVYFRIP